MPHDLGIENERVVIGGIDCLAGAIRVVLRPATPPNPATGLWGRVCAGEFPGKSEVGFGGVEAKTVEVLVERGAVQRGQIEGDRGQWGSSFAEQVVAGEVLLGEGDQGRVRRGRMRRGEELAVDVGRDVLDADLVEARLGWEGKRGLRRHRRARGGRRG